jgi:4-hydroxy-3-polyprenylbenzoate decarboxylase
MYSSLRKCAQDLEKNGHLIRIKTEVDPYLEMAEIHRRIFDKPICQQNCSYPHL